MRTVAGSEPDRSAGQAFSHPGRRCRDRAADRKRREFCREALPRAVAAALAAVTLVAPRPAFSQGSCTVPSTGPGAADGGGVRTLPPGNGWVQLTLSHLDTQERFGAQGRAEGYPAAGHLVVRSLAVAAAVGLADGLEVQGRLPIHSLTFEEVSGSRGNTEFGDPAVSVRVGPQLLGIARHELPFDAAIRGRVKLPGGQFPVDAQIIPLTEGQGDWELALEAGRRFEAVPLYVKGWLGYRWREENEKIQRRPGNEHFAYLALGGTASFLQWKVAVQGLDGGVPRIIEGDVPSARRSMLALSPAVSFPAGPGTLEFGGRIPVDGRNLPAGNVLSVGYFLDWGDDS